MKGLIEPQIDWPLVNTSQSLHVKGDSRCLICGWWCSRKSASSSKMMIRWENAKPCSRVSSVVGQTRNTSIERHSPAGLSHRSRTLPLQHLERWWRNETKQQILRTTCLSWSAAETAMELCLTTGRASSPRSCRSDAEHGVSGEWTAMRDGHAA